MPSRIVTCKGCPAKCADMVTVMLPDEAILSAIVGRRRKSNGHCARCGGWKPRKQGHWKKAKEVQP